jgi:hypothetical protein
MDTFTAHDTGPGWHARVAAQLREDGLAVLTGITSGDRPSTSDLT